MTAAFYPNNTFLLTAIMTGLLVGVGVVGLTIYMHDTFENRPKFVTSINVWFEVLTVVAVATAIGLVGV